jgi:hypothetical protein
MAISIWVVFLVMVRSKKLKLLLDSRLGLRWMQLWIELMNSGMFLGVVRVEF